MINEYKILEKINREALGTNIIKDARTEFSGTAVAKIRRSNGIESYVGVYYDKINGASVMCDPETNLGQVSSIVEIYAYDSIKTKKSKESDVITKFIIPKDNILSMSESKIDKEFISYGKTKAELEKYESVQDK